jgi:hypothetical protein
MVIHLDGLKVGKIKSMIYNSPKFGGVLVADISKGE